MLNNKSYDVVKCYNNKGDKEKNKEMFENFKNSENLNFFIKENPDNWGIAISFSGILKKIKSGVDFFTEFIQDNSNEFIDDFLGSLALLNNLRNSETHFFISATFLKDNEFVQLYNLMIDLTILFRHFNLINFGFSGEPLQDREDRLLLFKRQPLNPFIFSYKSQFARSEKLAIIKECLKKEKIIYSDNCFDVANISYCLLPKESFCFEEVYTYFLLAKEFGLIDYQDPNECNTDENGEELPTSYYTLHFN